MTVSFSWSCKVIPIIACYKNLKACADFKCQKIISGGKMFIHKFTFKKCTLQICRRFLLHQEMLLEEYPELCTDIVC